MDYPEMVSCRMTSDDLDRLTASAKRAGMARSEYLRTIIRIPASASGKGAVYVIDNRTMAKMLSELIRWGRHYNQAVRALNTHRAVHPARQPARVPSLQRDALRCGGKACRGRAGPPGHRIRADGYSRLHERKR